MEYVENVMNQELDMIGVNFVMLKDPKKILKIGLVENGNKVIDELIQHSQFNATYCFNCLEWIPFENFQDVTYITRGGFGKIYSAFWPKGSIWYWDIENQRWRKQSNKKVALKSLDNSSDISEDFLNEVINNLY